MKLIDEYRRISPPYSYQAFTRKIAKGATVEELESKIKGKKDGIQVIMAKLKESPSRLRTERGLLNYLGTIVGDDNNGVLMDLIRCEVIQKKDNYYVLILN